MNPIRHRAAVISTQVDVLAWDEAIHRISSWGRAHESRYVCFSNVHSAVTAAFDARFSAVINDSDMCTSDGAPITWMIRQLGAPQQPRLNGPDLMWRYLASESRRGGKVYFYGSTPDTLKLLKARVESEFPGLQVVGCYSPPFRPASAVEDNEDVERINASGAEVVFIGLGCPKQEVWMSEHRGRIKAVMIGVGAAFDFHAGVKTRAPEWMQSAGLEWAYRLAQEPKRLWRRYLFTNIPFLLMGGAQWISSRLTGARPAAFPARAAATHAHNPYAPAETRVTGEFAESRFRL
ncbi:MAG: WecB/TagA/CpsF family glycosyltransferase [Rubrivivax sp.]|nr:WecB/TagA/CpsF family glycosyltransferase [Rubrivivax sp.]